MSVGDPAETVLPPAPLATAPGQVRPSNLPPIARRLAIGVAALMGFALPVLMVVANKSAPAVLAAAAVAAHAAVLLAGRGADLAARYRKLVGSPLVLLTASILALLVLSGTWSIDAHLTTRGLIEGVPELVFLLGLAATWPLIADGGDAHWLRAGIVVAGLLILFEHGSGMPLHALVRARGEAWDLKRSAVPPLLLLWPAIAMAWPQRRFALVAGLVVAVAIGIAASHSGAPGAALGLGAAIFALAIVTPRLALGVTGVGLAVLIVSAPWTGSILTRALPPDARQELREEHAEHRLTIWSAFEHRGFDRPWLGHGFNASFSVATAPRPDGSPPPADSSHIVGFHPHDVMLQFWIELGSLGLVAAAVALSFTFGRLIHHRGPALAARLGLLVGVLGVGLVGLSAWQPWWIACVGAALLWFERAERGI